MLAIKDAVRVKKRKVDLVVISDVHLGTFGCHAKELLLYLNSIKPKHIILNGDIIDIWQFRKRYFPKSHLEVIKKLIDLSAKGTEVTYITGNHDDLLRKFTDVEMGRISLVDKLVLDLDGKKAWFFHGDVFDSSIQNARWLAKLGGWGYDILILINRFVNWCLIKMNREKFSLSKKIKNSVKKAIKHIQDFEKVASDLAIENNYKYVICGHIHQPQIVRKVNKTGTCLYLNSGDWIENLTSLEYHKGRWDLKHFNKEEYKPEPAKEQDFNEIQNLVAAITITTQKKK